MLDLNRIYGLDINLDDLKEFNPTIEFKQYDYQTSFIAFRFYKKDTLIENIDENYIIGVFKDEEGNLFVNTDGKPIRTYAFTYEEEKGIVILPISREVINSIGKIYCEMIIINKDGRKITSPRFNFTIVPSLLDYQVETETQETVCGTFKTGERLCGYGNVKEIDVYKYIEYVKTVWVDGETVVNQDRLNNMENGIYQVSQYLNSLDASQSSYETSTDTSISTVKDALDKLVETTGNVYEGDEPPQDTSLIWYDTSDKGIDEKLDSLIINELKTIIYNMSSEISYLKEKVEYLMNNQGNGGTLPDSPSEGDCIILEDGSYLLLEDGSKILLEF